MLTALIAAATFAVTVIPPDPALDWQKYHNANGTPKALQDPKTKMEWPNATSKANSDPWLVENHDLIQVMHPRILLLNFTNRISDKDVMLKTYDLLNAYRESSRYHGYKDAMAPVFMQPVIWKYINLGEKDGKKDEASELSPRHKEVKEGFNCDYAALFGEKFAEYYGVRDPKNPKRFMKLAELIDQGYVHEMWMVGADSGIWHPFECIELKQCYDEKFKKIAGKNVQAGNGTTDQPWTGRSFKINYINYFRGIGCGLEDLGHSYESVSHSKAIPYFTKYFAEYCGFDLDKRYKMPFDSFYGLEQPTWADACLPNEILKYPNPTTVEAKHKGQWYKIENYVVKGGNLHFPPNARANYDQGNSTPVMCTIEDYRCGSGPDGKDIAIPWTFEHVERYKYLAPDCMGKWITYWRQNMPGLHNFAKDDAGKPMKNWWVFLYY